jgi:hypothetical protein
MQVRFIISIRSVLKYSTCHENCNFVVGCGLDGTGLESLQGKEIFLVSTTSMPALGPTQFPIQWVAAFIIGMKRPGIGVDCSRPFIAEDKNEWSCTPTPSICLYGVDRNIFMFLMSASFSWILRRGRVQIAFALFSKYRPIKMILSKSIQ